MCEAPRGPDRGLRGRPPRRSVGGAAHQSASNPGRGPPAGPAKSDTRKIEFRDAFDNVRRRLRQSRRKTVLAEKVSASWLQRTPSKNQGAARYKPVASAFPLRDCAEKARYEDGEGQ